MATPSKPRGRLHDGVRRIVVQNATLFDPFSSGRNIRLTLDGAVSRFPPG
jgi:hypothetical protein